MTSETAPDDAVKSNQGVPKTHSCADPLRFTGHITLCADKEPVQFLVYYSKNIFFFCRINSSCVKHNSCVISRLTWNIAAVRRGPKSFYAISFPTKKCIFSDAG